MKTFMNRIRANAVSVIDKTKAVATAFLLTLATVGNNLVCAAGDPASVVKAAIGVVVDIFPYIGAFFVVAGVFKLILAYRNDQPEAQAGAAKDIVIGAVFIVFKVFVWSAIEPTIF